MFSRKFEYTGYDGQPHADTYWFNLTEAELLKMELGRVGGIRNFMNKLLKEDRPSEIVDMFEKMILGSVGERSADGRRFIKSKEIADDFYSTPAYSQLFVELVTDGKKLSAFIQHCIPAEMAAKLAQKENDLEEAGLTMADVANGNEKAEAIIRSAEESIRNEQSSGLSVVKD